MFALNDAKGLFVVTQTPFDADGQVDLASIDSLVDFYIEHGADGFTVLGVAGEAAKLTADEAEKVTERFIQRAQGRPVIVGVSNPSMAHLSALTARAMDLGATGVMVAPPTGLKTEEELLNYFGTLFHQIGDVPTVLQDFPFSTGVWMSVASMLRLIETHPQIQLIKEEDLPSLAKIERLRESKGRRVAIMTGNNGVYLPLEMARGIDGPMAGFSHPEMLSGVYKHCVAGNVDAAHDLFDRYLPLLSHENQSQWGVAVRKEILKRRGAIRHATMRQPGPKLRPQDYKDIDLLLSRLHRSLAEMA